MKESKATSHYALEPEKAQTYFELQARNLDEEKRFIAKHIVNEYLQGGDSIILDAGTSLYPIAQEIADEVVNEPGKTYFTIMTHNYRGFEMLVGIERSSNRATANLNVVLAGGRYDRDLNALFGPQTMANYEQFFPRVVLVGASGFVADEGLFCHGNTEELSVKRVIIQKRCRDRVIITDCTKLGSRDALKFADAKEYWDLADRCVVVTNKPGPKHERFKDRYQREAERLRSNRNVVFVELEAPIGGTHPTEQGHTGGAS